MMPEQLQNIFYMVLPWLLILLGLSFLYKAVIAIFWGKFHYWKGFLPISVVSPFFTHLPASPKSPVKLTATWWAHIILGPIFLFLSFGLFALGADLMGAPGTETVNSALTMGHKGKAPIVFERGRGYRFPILDRLGKKMHELMSKPIFKEEPDPTAPH